MANCPEETSPAAWSRPHRRSSSVQLRPLTDGWQLGATAPGRLTGPSGLDGLEWLPAQVPGTAAGALQDAGAWNRADPMDFDAQDWWFRTRLDAGDLDPAEEAHLRFDGIATLSEVYLDGEQLLRNDSMFAAREVDVSGRLRDGGELAVCCRSLAQALRQPRRPRARWRTRLVADGNLRFFRTTLLGRIPGFADGPAPVGPWRAVALERRRGPYVEELLLRPRLDGDTGVLSLRARIRAPVGARPGGVELELEGPTGIHRGPISTEDGADAGVLAVAGELRVPDVARWWPHTHGAPDLYAVRLHLEGSEGSTAVASGSVGFRTLAFSSQPAHDVERDGLAVHVNGVPVFVRGAVWTPADPIGLAPSSESLRAQLELVREAGMNMLRLAGTGVYETVEFHDLCDRLGILVWQDLMFANLDYPFSDPDFAAASEAEARSVLAGLAARPSLAVVCGNSEVEQQAAMVGLDPRLGRGQWFGERLPGLVHDSGADAAYVPSAPCGGALPFRPNRGIASYFGIGAYRRPLEDARRSEVRFAAECLAFSNVPAEEVVAELTTDTAEAVTGHVAAWKRGIPHDTGASWDYEDIRDYYLEVLFGLEPQRLRWIDHDRYLALSRAVGGEVMAEVFGEWRRAASPCGGGIVLWLRDLLPGAGWGLLDHRGTPKLAYHVLRRALAPVCVWMLDEGLSGIAVHVANDRPEPLRARLRLALYRDLEHELDRAELPIELPPHSEDAWDLEELLGRFVDAGWTYRFGAPSHDAIFASLLGGAEGRELLSQAARFPLGRPCKPERAGRLGLRVEAARGESRQLEVTVSSRRVAHGVRVRLAGHTPDDDGFSIEPGGQRTVRMRPLGAAQPNSEVGTREGIELVGTVTALNL